MLAYGEQRTNDQLYKAEAAIRYNYEALAEIYNNTRVDYIVPMPMNARRMIEYVHHYDIDLEASIVIVDAEGNPMGLGMLGRRDGRAWITRMGLVPEGRGKGLGNLMMETLFENARVPGDTMMQLEVIKNNAPAHQMFLKYGFEPTRELMVIRRPINAPVDTTVYDDAVITALTATEIEQYLKEKRSDVPSWIEETASIINAGQLEGYRLTDETGEEGWIIFQNTAFKITHIVTGNVASGQNLSNGMMKKLLSYIHQSYPMKDTQVENVPADDPLWQTYRELSYIETFRRIEMVCNL